MDSGLIAAAVAAAVVILGALGTWLAVRRTASGRIGTSEAAILWEQAQVIPALTVISASLRQITDSLARLERDR